MYKSCTCNTFIQIYVDKWIAFIAFQDTALLNIWDTLNRTQFNSFFLDNNTHISKENWFVQRLTWKSDHFCTHLVWVCKIKKQDQNLILARGNLRETFSYYIFVPHFVRQKSIIGSLPLSHREQKCAFS